jgi:hypothetical protein
MVTVSKFKPFISRWGNHHEKPAPILNPIKFFSGLERLKLDIRKQKLACHKHLATLLPDFLCAVKKSHETKLDKKSRKTFVFHCPFGIIWDVVERQKQWIGGEGGIRVKCYFK